MSQPNHDQSADLAVTVTCTCDPCPGRGNDGHGMTHCAECCFGTGVEVDLDCPAHGDGLTYRIPPVATEEADRA